MSRETFIIPNYFIEEQPQNVISSDSLFTVAYSSRLNNDNMAIRNVMHVMILLVEGTKRLNIVPKEKHIEEKVIHADSIMLLAQGNYFMSEVLSKDAKYESILVCFDDTFIMDFITKYHIDLSEVDEQSVLSFGANGLLKSLIQTYKLHMSPKLAHTNDIIKLKTEEVFLYLLSENRALFSSFLKAVSLSSKERMKYILEANLDLIDTVDDMAKILRISKSELRAKMKKSYSMQPKEWLDAKRLEQASLLLKNTDESISSVALSCGYATSSWFGVQFKKAYGVTPKNYREQNR